MKKIISIFLYILVLQGCGFTPMYSKNQIADFYIENVSFNNADPDFALFIKNNLKNYSTGKNKQKFNIDIKMNYSKTSLSKNSLGETDMYLLTSIIEFTISSENKEKKFQVKESLKIKNLNDEFNEKNYEKNAKKNMAELSTSKLLMQLSRFNDN